MLGPPFSDPMGLAVRRSTPDPGLGRVRADLRRVVVQIGEPKHLVGQPDPEVRVFGVGSEEFSVGPDH